MDLNSSNNSFIAIIGDIINSKKLKDRNEIQIKLKHILNSINENYSEDIASNFMITLGDEFQGLLNNGENAIKIINEIENKMYPIEIRFGIGVGEITTEINRDMPLGADGPAYHNARKTINALKLIENKSNIGNTNILIATDNIVTDNLMNSIFALCYIIKKKWSPRQKEIITAYLNSDTNQIKTANNLGITQSSVNKGLNNSGYYSYKNALDEITDILSEIKVIKNV